MKAWQMHVLGDPWSELKVVEVDPPSVDDGMLRIAVDATDLNFADILQCQGRYQVKRTPPFTPGLNAAGTVLEAAPGSGFAVGETVVGPTVGNHGGYAEQAQRLPDGIDPITAAGTHITHGTAWFALHQRGRLQPGETVLVLAAAGGVGAAAVQLARLHGCWVVAAAGGAAKCAACRDLGADAVIDYNDEDLYARVMELTGGRGVDVVYDPVGGRWFDVARRLVAWEGRLLVVGFASGDIPSAPANHALVKNYSIVGVHMGGYRERDPGPFERCYRELHEWLLAGRFEPLISEVIGFDELPAALRRLADRGTTGRVIFDPRR